MKNFSFLVFILCLIGCKSAVKVESKPPNILFIMGEDMSWKHFSTYGEEAIETTAFDKLANLGILFENAYCPAPSCAPSRSSTLTGRPIWQLGPAASIYTFLPKEYKTYQDALEQNGYTVGYCGKGWGPGEIESYGRTRNPAGPEFKLDGALDKKNTEITYEDNFKNIQSTYAQDFKFFLNQKEKNKPFSFWIGTSDAHRSFEKNKYLEFNIDPAKVTVPAFFPDTEEIRKEIADYLFEVKCFDNTIAEVVEVLKDQGEYENTIIIATADHGWSFPRGKGSLYEYGMHVPLVFHYPKGFKNTGKVTDFVSLTEISSTILHLTGTTKPTEMSSESFHQLLYSTTEEAETKQIVLGHERHSPYRKDGLGYPMRAIRNDKYYYIQNKKPERWPAGAPPHFADPSDKMVVREFILSKKDQPEFKKFFDWGYELRPPEELYDMENDPFQLQNLAVIPEYQSTKKELKEELDKYLKRTGDPRMLSNSTEWDSMPWIGKWKYPEYMPSNQQERVRIFQEKYQ